MRLIIVSNRLPVTITKKENGSFEYAMSSGGLVSAISGLKKKMAFTWIGWPGFILYNPGLELGPEDQDIVRNNLVDTYSCVPIFLDDSVADKHYNGFSNRCPFDSFRYPLFKQLYIMAIVSLPSR
jgi:trehalose-6-phosphate synthase